MAGILYTRPAAWLRHESQLKQYGKEFTEFLVGFQRSMPDLGIGFQPVLPALNRQSGRQTEITFLIYTTVHMYSIPC